MSEPIKKDTSVIPEGPYCYEPIGWEGNLYHVKVCPYFKRKEDGDARCEFLEIEDDPALWDQCKVCGENTLD